MLVYSIHMLFLLSVIQSQLLSAVLVLLLIGVTVTILFANKAPQVLIAWLLAIYLVPVVGILLYFLTGIDWKKRKIMKQLPEEAFREHLGNIIERQATAIDESIRESENDIAKAITLINNCNFTPLSTNNECSLQHHGSDFIERLLEDLERAESSIHMEFFIWRSDSVGRRVKDVLTAKARQGVEVRLLFDGVGCFGRIARRYKAELRESGVEYRYFLDPVTILFSRLINYRNHRKIVVIDGVVGYTGGMNLGVEYVTGGRKFPDWRDTQLRLRGDSVRLLQTVFLTDWYNSSGERLEDFRYFPKTDRIFGFLPTQVLVSGPDSFWSSIRRFYCAAIANANSKVYIESPYFIPDESVRYALSTAALSGVDVQIIMTGLPDKLIPFWAAHTYFDRMLEAGVTIFLYREGFYHSKALIVDGTIAVVGSSNLDIRSFQLNYELVCVFYNRRIAEELEENFERDKGGCRRVGLEECEKRPLSAKFRNAVARIFAPIL